MNKTQNNIEQVPQTIMDILEDVHLADRLKPDTPVAIYTRSAQHCSEDQPSPLSRQRHSCEQFAASRRWKVVQIYEDNGFSGNNDQRPALQRMLTDAQNGKFRALLVDNLARLSRSISGLLSMLELLKAQGVTIVVTEPPPPHFQR